MPVSIHFVMVLTEGGLIVLTAGLISIVLVSLSEYTIPQSCEYSKCLASLNNGKLDGILKVSESSLYDRFVGMVLLVKTTELGRLRSVIMIFLGISGEAEKIGTENLEENSSSLTSNHDFLYW